MLLYIFIFILALCTCLYITPIVMEAAITYDIVDKPDGNLKNHQRPVAYLGGIAIYLSFLATLALTFDFSREVLGLLLAATIVILLGIIDDLKPLGPKVKLLGQIIAIFVLIKCGIYIQIAIIPDWLGLSVPSQELGDALLGIGMTFFWMLAVINAFNIIDIMDGLSAGIGLIASLVLFVIAIINSHFMMAVMSLALVGSLLGFLRYNFQPAKIYLGDAGSMFIGLMLGTLAMIGVYTEQNHVGYLAPLVILGVPLYDTMLVMYLRWRKGMSVIHGSPDHFALRLRKSGLTTRQTVLSAYAVGLILAVAALGMKLVPTAELSGSIFLGIAACGLAATLWLKRINME
jgi:UDP-GlcNAc:undecaprenyl-phosphate GlcNAc-1-phosphate transferase